MSEGCCEKHGETFHLYDCCLKCLKERGESLENAFNQIIIMNEAEKVRFEHLKEKRRRLEEHYKLTGPVAATEIDAVRFDLMWAVTMLEKTAAPAWIPCSERMPELNQLVLIGNSIHMAVARWIDGRWYNGTMSFVGISHWMPLPEMPPRI